MTSNDVDVLQLFYVLDTEGCPVHPTSRQDWYEFMEQPDRKRMALTEVNDVRISTVFLGIDHDFNEDNDPNYKPLIYETMIFGGPLDQEQQRYRTPAEWRAGHERWVERVREASKISDET